jgi:hypothetical protein
MNLQTQICSHPIFIVGAPRSGTSILAESLAQHSQLWTSQESDILFDLYGEDSHVSKAFQKTIQRRTNGWLQEHGVEEAEYLGYVGLGLNALFTTRSRGKRWIDQTPLYTNMIELLADMFPDAFFLHILRDGRRVVHSMINYLGSDGSLPRGLTPDHVPEWATDFGEACITWRRYVEIAMNFCEKNPTRCLTVVNEQLVANPDRAFRRIREFIRVPFEEEPADYFRLNRINSSFHVDLTRDTEDQQLSEPWKEWNLEQKTNFFYQAGPTLLKTGLATEAELSSLIGGTAHGVE